MAGDRLHTVLLSESSVTDAGLILLTQHSSRLTCLDVSQCDQLSGGSIRSIAEVCRLLCMMIIITITIIWGILKCTILHTIHIHDIVNWSLIR